MPAYKYDTILKKIQDCVLQRKQVDYADNQSVRSFNRAYDRCKRYVDLIDQFYPEHLEDFCTWVLSSDWELHLTCAPMILKLKNASFCQKKRMAQSIVAQLGNPDVPSDVKLGFSMNIRSHKYDEWLVSSAQSGDGPLIDLK